MSVFETATRVGLVVRAPWLPHSVGRVTSVVVELVSVYRSIAELAGITSVESSVEGTSFASVLRNKEPVYDAGSAPAFGGVALSQMTRCAKATANATLSQGYDPCCTTPGKASLYTFMGYSLRSETWRLTIWARWDNVTLCPDWADPGNAVELYDHRTDTTPLDLDSFENVNVATDAANAGVLQQLTTQVHSLFGSRNCKRPTNSEMIQQP